MSDEGRNDLSDYIQSARNGCARVIWKHPSPSTQTTVASGRGAAFAPIAAGMP